MQLSQEAIKKLRKILSRELGQRAEQFSDSELNDLGVRMLKLTASVMKRKVKSA